MRLRARTAFSEPPHLYTKEKPMESARNLEPNTVEQIKSLIVANTNSASIFREASSMASSNDLKALFDDIASHRDENTSALQEGLALSGEFEPAKTNLVEPLQKWWMKARDLVQSENHRGVLEELERSEDRILDAYKEALVSSAGSPMNKALLEQVTRIKRDHDSIRALRDRSREMAS